MSKKNAECHITWELAGQPIILTESYQPYKPINKRRKGRPGVAKNKTKCAETEFANEQQIGYHTTKTQTQTKHQSQNLLSVTQSTFPSLYHPFRHYINQGRRPAVHAFPTMGCGPRAMGVQGITYARVPAPAHGFLPIPGCCIRGRTRMVSLHCPTIPSFRG